MSGKYSSPFDDLLASNQKQMDDVLGGPGRSYAPRPAAPTSVTASPPPSDNTGGNTISGTANGIPFSLKV
ncbi:MAG: hypothetical protein HOE62_20835 [Alphaproteobacteria bacterium]|jgi:hypothetical protein|nr:hypothetical protein [Alphaproteobacteria bacterium]